MSLRATPLRPGEESWRRPPCASKRREFLIVPAMTASHDVIRNQSTIHPDCNPNLLCVRLTQCITGHGDLLQRLRPRLCHSIGERGGLALPEWASNRLYIPLIPLYGIEGCLLPWDTLQDAKEKGPRETLLYVPAIIPDQSRPDYLATVDADPESKTYSKVPGSRGVDRRWDPCRTGMCGRRVQIKVADQGRALHSPTFLSRSSTACP